MHFASHVIDPRYLDRYCACNEDFVRVWAGSCGLEADGLNELVEIVDDALVEAVELGPVLAVEPGVGLDGREEAGGQRGVDAFEELQEDEADRVAVGKEPVAARARQLFDEALGAKF